MHALVDQLVLLREVHPPTPDGREARSQYSDMRTEIQNSAPSCMAHSVTPACPNRAVEQSDRFCRLLVILEIHSDNPKADPSILT